MYSIKRMPKPFCRENSTSGRMSSSLTPRSTTAFNLIGASPVVFAAKIPSSTLLRSPRLVMRLNLSASRVSMLMLTRRRPACFNASTRSANRAPLVVRQRSSSPLSAASFSIKRGRSWRTKGSPPVSRTLSTPNSMNNRAKRAISSNVRTSFLLIHSYSSNGIQ